MTRPLFNDANIDWQTLDGIEHVQFSILDIDERNKIVDMILKFAADRQIILHRHKAWNNTFVIQGEHRFYEADGALKEIRPVGQYTCNQASDEPHREGAGEVDAIVMFSIRGGDGVLYELLDDDGNLVSTIGMQDLVTLYSNPVSSAQT